MGRLWKRRGEKSKPAALIVFYIVIPSASEGSTLCRPTRMRSLACARDDRFLMIRCRNDQPMNDDQSLYYLDTSASRPICTPLHSSWTLPRDGQPCCITDASKEKLDVSDNDTVGSLITMHRRLVVETWLDAAAMQGVIIRAQHPLYFQISRRANATDLQCRPSYIADRGCRSYPVAHSRLAIVSANYRHCRFYHMTPHCLHGTAAV